MFTGALTSAGIYGGVGGDSMVFSAAISNSTIDFGADADTLSPRSTARPFLVLGQHPCLHVRSQPDHKFGFRWRHADSLVFSVTVGSASSIAGGGSNDTMVFNSSLSGAVVSLDSGADSVGFVTKVAGSSTLFGGQAFKRFNSALQLTWSASTEHSAPAH